MPDRNPNPRPVSSAIYYETNIRKLRQNYIIILAVIIIGMIITYFWGPMDLIAQYLSGYIFPISFICILIFAFMICMISFYTYSIKNNDFGFINNPSEMIPIIIFKYIGIGLLGFCLSGVLIYLCLLIFGFKTLSDTTSNTTTTNTTTTTSWSQYFIQIAIIIIGLGIIYKVLIKTDLVSKNQYFNLFVSLLLYIPCLFVNFLELVTYEGLRFYHTTSKTVMILIALEFILITAYYLYPIIKSWVYTHYYASNGMQLINYPAPLNTLAILASYGQLNGMNSEGTDNYAYNYCISFWYYIDSMPPSINSSYSKYTSLLSYGGKPNVLFNPSLNTLMITVDQDSVKQLEESIKEEITKNADEYHKVRTTSFIDVDDNGNRIVYQNDKVLLQKWNNVIINYSGGTLDIFYNGELTQSSIEVVPYLTFDNLTIGTDNGISGGISNLYYYTKALDITQIKNLYDSVKDQKMPVMPNNTDVFTFTPN